ncbi:MAG: bifunctional phosphoribosyl-AMP cyclohydrolase/phosphoribosyl-ATP diphosphatase HisIE [Hellea sp.]|nr:bifunctional phosphoribosyl-AMP cyclohydrolase/phosphoribosyl-ATP diphosphatase HisIE [Hellea sp.]
MTFNLNQIDFDKGAGLVPAIVQDVDTARVLMLGYMNRDAVAKTQTLGQVTFFSRSKNRLWTKGETSGNTLELIDIKLDCDRDTLLVSARPNGPTCHLGTQSCFGDGAPEGLGFLSYLEELIEGRKSADPSSSYTAKLLSGPLRKAAQKVGEEGVETALAAVDEDDTALKGEAADLIYHLMVVLAARDVTLTDVIGVLKERHK